MGGHSLEREMKVHSVCIISNAMNGYMKLTFFSWRRHNCRHISCSNVACDVLRRCVFNAKLHSENTLDLGAHRRHSKEINCYLRQFGIETALCG